MIKFWLNFFSCYEITDDGIHQLSQALTRLSSLKDLELNFSQYKNRYFQFSKINRCKQVSDIGLNYIGEGLPHNLRHVTLKLSW
jgi:hypothetical protein